MQEDGVATAIESIYRDLEYARSLIKRGAVEDISMSDEDEEGATIRHRNSKRNSRDAAHSGYSSSGSTPGALSEDWSVISDQDDRRSSLTSRHSEGKSTDRSSQKRNSLAAAVLSVLPDSLTSSNPRRRSISAHSRP